MSEPSDDARDCVFCRIVRRDLPATIVLETADALVFLDVNPVTPGHLLLVPKAHHPDLTTLPDDLAAHAGSLLPRLCRAVVAATGAEGFNVVVNNGRVAGQTVDHGHWHVIPRSPDDPVHWPWPHTAYAPGERDQLRDRLLMELRGSGDGR